MQDRNGDRLNFVMTQIDGLLVLPVSKGNSVALLNSYRIIASIDPRHECLDLGLAKVLLARFASYGFGDGNLSSRLMEAFVTPFIIHKNGHMLMTEDDDPTKEEKVDRIMLASILYNASGALFSVSYLGEEILDATGLPYEMRQNLMLFKNYYQSLIPAAQVDQDVSHEYIAELKELRSKIVDHVSLKDRLQADLRRLKEVSSKDKNAQELKDMTLKDILHFILSSPISAQQYDRYDEEFFKLCGVVSDYAIITGEKVFNICSQFCVPSTVEYHTVEILSLKDLTQKYIKPFMDENFPGVFGI